MSRDEKPVFFMDENLLGKRIAGILRDAGVRVELLSDHFPKQTPDVEWLSEVSQRGWLVLSRDLSIATNIAEEVAVAKSNAKMFALEMGNAPLSDLRRDLENAIAKIQRFANSHPAPFIARVYPYGKVTMGLNRERLLKTLRKYEPMLEE